MNGLIKPEYNQSSILPALVQFEYFFLTGGTDFVGECQKTAGGLRGRARYVITGTEKEPIREEREWGRDGGSGAEGGEACQRLSSDGAG